MIYLKSKTEIDALDEANRFVHRCLDLAETVVADGTATIDVDRVIEAYLNTNNVKSAFEGYKNYPAHCCISINDEVVHGIPNKNRIIKNGDLVSVDVGVVYNGFVGDAARTILVGEVSNEAKKLSESTHKALYAGIEQMVVGNTLQDISKAIEKVAKTIGYGNLKNYCGHGVGKNMHEQPSVYNYTNPMEPNIHLQEGLVLALEPMFSLGSSDGIVDKDGWTVRTSDGSLSAHWELSVAIVDGKAKLLGI